MKTNNSKKSDTKIAIGFSFLIAVFLLPFLTLGLVCEAVSADTDEIVSWNISADSDSSVFAKLYKSGEKYSLVISGTGEMKEFSSPSDIPWSQYFANIEKAAIEKGVKNLSHYAFSKCYSLVEVKIYERNLTLPVSTDVFYFTVNIYAHKGSTAEIFACREFPSRFYLICDFKDGKCAECGYECKHTGGVPTCTEGGKCTVCNTEYLSALNHRISDLVPEEKALCYKKGIKEHYTCLECDALFDSSKQPTTKEALEFYSEHDYGKLKSSSPPSCTEPGIVAHYECSMCKKFFNEDKEEVADIIILEKGHSGGVPTCLKGAVCTECTTEYTEPDLQKHNFGGKLTYDDSTHWFLCVCGVKDKIVSHSLTDTLLKEATVDETGVIESKCDCGYKTNKMIPKLDDSQVEGDTSDSAKNTAIPFIICGSLIFLFAGVFTLCFIIKRKQSNRL